jgi:hypothetical protein
VTTIVHSSPFREVPDVAVQFDWKSPTQKGPGAVHLLMCEEPAVDDIVLTAPKGTIARVVRGHRCISKERTLQEWSAALQFPSYFGNNWDAFEECINDLEWLGASRIVVFVTRADEMLPRSPKDLPMMLNILSAAEQAKSLHIVFHCSPGRSAHLCQRMDKARKDSSRR